jgi:hypothetical protein
MTEQCVIESYELTAGQIWGVAFVAGVSGAALVVIVAFVSEFVREWWQNRG